MQFAFGFVYVVAAFFCALQVSNAQWVANTTTCTSTTVRCAKTGRTQEDCINIVAGGTIPCRWISKFSDSIKRACRRAYKGDVEKCYAECEGSFGCWGRPNSGAVEQCHYTCKALCQSDRACTWKNGKGCGVRGGGRRQLKNILTEAARRSTQECVTQVLATTKDALINTPPPSASTNNPLCKSSCASGCCYCGCSNFDRAQACVSQEICEQMVGDPYYVTDPNPGEFCDSIQSSSNCYNAG